MQKDNVSKFFKDAGMVLTKHTPEILTGIGIAGMVTSTILAVKATPKAMRLIEEKQNNQEQPLTKSEKFKTCWKCYIPTAVTAASSIACLVGASTVHLKRNTALLTAYKLSETALIEYKDKVVETIGEKKEKAIKDSLAKDRIEQNPVTKSEVIVTGGGETLCYDYYSGRYFKSDIERIRGAVNDINREIGNSGYASLNDFYSLIGLSDNEVGNIVGWNTDMRKLEVHFSSMLAENGQPAVVISFMTDPKHGYDKFF